MTGGFAFIAYPEKYGDTGIATFIINQNGIVYQKDLGKNTTEDCQRRNRIQSRQNLDTSARLTYT